eukprot:g2742.t1
MSADGKPQAAKVVRVGVLALQGAFEEHVAAFHRCDSCTACEVRTPAELEPVDALVIPGGESTTIAKLARENGLWSVLEAWVRDGRPIWGTCAGLILLSDHLSAGEAEGGQARLGGLAVETARNYFGAQVRSFERALEVPSLGGAPYSAIFIRAPAVLAWADGVTVLASLPARAVAGGGGGAPATEAAAGAGAMPPTPPHVAVAVRQGHVLGTAFHPELTADVRWHQEFLRMARAALQEEVGEGGA